MCVRSASGPKDLSLLTMTLLVCTFAVTAHAQETAADTKSELRQQFMKVALSNFEVSVVQSNGEQSKRKEARLHGPLLRWSNPLEGPQDGVIGLFTSSGRPDVHIEFMIFSADHVAQEFTAITKDPIEVKRHGKLIWKPKDRWNSFREIPGTPSANATRRKFEMKAIARRFRFVDHFGFEDTNIQTNDLRLIARPVYQYQDETHNVVDGAVFLFTLGTDPEALLLIEAREDSQGNRTWHYACAESSIYGLEAFLDGKKVWEKDRAKIFNNMESTHYAGDYVPQPEEASLKDAF